MAIPSFSYDERSHRYRYTSGSQRGRFVSKAKAENLLRAAIAQESQRAERITANLLNGGITLKEWEAGMAGRIKSAHSKAYLLGKGGVLRYDNAQDKGILGAKIRSEYRYLRDFSKNIRAGKYSEAQIRAYTRQYFNSIYGTKELARRRAHTESGYKFESDHRTAGESCDSCIRYESAGIVPIGQNPPIGVDRECGGNCRCYKKYYKNRPSNSGLLGRSWGWVA